jgi:hypothetical protein
MNGNPAERPGFCFQRRTKLASAKALKTKTARQSVRFSDMLTMAVPGITDARKRGGNPSSKPTCFFHLHNNLHNSLLIIWSMVGACHQLCGLILSNWIID